MRRLRTTAGILALVVGGVAGCSDSEPITADPPRPTTPGTPTGSEPGRTDPSTAADGGLPAGCKRGELVALCLTFDFTGDVAVKGSTWWYAGVGNSTADIGSCSDYGREAAAANELVIGQVDKLVGDAQVQMQFSSSKSAAGAAPGGYLRVDDRAFESRNGNTTGAMSVRPDGSGKIELRKLVETGGTDADATAAISGTITWTCMEPA